MVRKTSDAKKLEIKQELQNDSQAEKDYKTAVYMVPNRMISRYDLLNYYIARKDTANVIYWCKSILYMPVKIPSQITVNIREQTKTILVQMSK